MVNISVSISQMKELMHLPKVSGRISVIVQVHLIHNQSFPLGYAAVYLQRRILEWSLVTHSQQEETFSWTRHHICLLNEWLILSSCVPDTEMDFGVL